MSNDMLNKVTSRRVDFNNKELFTSNTLLFRLKVFYYKLFLLCYRICGQFVHVGVGNSNWTTSRIMDVWRRKDIQVLYPPAAIGNPIIPIEEHERRKVAIVSLAQFRPEKNQELQVRVFSRVLKSFPNAVFWMMGGCRNADDEKLIQRLRYIAFEELEIPQSKIEFIVNASREEVDRRLREAQCAIHTMVDEHFGISLLEYLDAQTPIVCHRSGGPELDIILPDERYGYLASSENEFVDKVSFVLGHFDSKEVKEKRLDGFNSLNRFYSDEQFGLKFASIFLA